MKLLGTPRKVSALFLVIGFVIGLITFTAVRFFAYSGPELTHYHANFALYINGQRDEFKSFTFYEEIQACSDESADNVKARVHMHDQNGGLIHVHAKNMTWGYFFANLGYGLTDKLVQNDTNVYQTNGNDKLTFWLNGKPEASIADRVIHSEDVLLINYGNDDDATLKQRYDAIPRDAHKANVTSDPSTCSGTHKVTTVERFKAALGFKVNAHE